MAFQGNAFQQNAIQSGTNDFTASPGQGGDPAPLPHLGLLLGAAAGGNTVNPTTGHLTFAGYVAGIEQDRSYAATTGHLTFAGYVSTLDQDRSYTPTTGHLTFAGYVAGIQQARSYAPTTGSLTFAGYAPGIDQDRSYTATTGHLTFAGYVAGVAQGGGLNPASLPHLGMGASAAAVPNVVSPTKGALSFTGYVPTVTQAGAVGPAYLPHIALGASPAPAIYSPATGHMSFVGYVPGVYGAIQPATGHLTFTGRVPTQGNQAIIVEWDDVGADAGYRVKWGTATNTYTWSADVATDVLTYTITSLTYGQTYYIRIYALVGGVEQDPSAEIRLTAGWCFLPTVGHLTFAGYVPGISQGSGNGATPTTGHLTFAGYAPGIEQDRSYAPTTGHLTFAGYVPSVAQARTVDTTTGHLTFAGYVPGIDQTGPRVVFPTEGHLFFRGYAPTVTGASAGTVFGGVPGYWPQPGQNKEWLRKVAREVAGPARTLPQRAQAAVAEVAAGYVGAWDQARAEAELRAALLAQSIKYQAVYFDLLARIYEQTLADAIARQAIAGIEQAQLDLVQAAAAARQAAQDEDDAIVLLLLS